VTRPFQRRAFLAGVAVAACEGRRPTSAGPPVASPPPAAQNTEPAAASGSVPRRTLGLTEAEVSAIGLGGYHLGVPDEAEAIRIMHRAIDEGITFFDNCWDYHAGESERRMGKALASGKRDRVFLMTKIDGRNQQAAARQLEDSLHRLRTDHVDLVQIHEVIRAEDPAWVFGKDGAIEALRAAQQAGKLRFIGFTGHKSPEIHLEMLRTAKTHEFRFDTVQMPLNVMDPHFKSFERHVLPVLTEQHIGVLGMKPLGSGDILESGVVSAEDCLRYALSLPTSVVITGCDSMRILEQALSVARAFKPLDAAERQALLDKTRPQGDRGQFEAFKTTERFDATSRNPHWLTEGTL
jgi:predicted aldo/keto reductase-like oxidoreductase